MATEISLLIPDFRKQLIRSLDAAKEKGLHFEVLTTVIPPMEQAALWKQGRTRTDAELKALALEHANAPFLAECIKKAVPQATNLETNLLPGYSWHQWGEAAQFIYVDGMGKIHWSVRENLGRVNGYREFAKILAEFSIHCGSEFEDSDVAWRTAVFRPMADAGQFYTVPQIDVEMHKRYKR